MKFAVGFFGVGPVRLAIAGIVCVSDVQVEHTLWVQDPLDLVEYVGEPIDVLLVPSRALAAHFNP